MLDFLFFAGLVLYFISVVVHFLGLAFRSEKLTRISWLVFYAAFALNTAYIVARGIVAHRLPLANQFEFATDTDGILLSFDSETYWEEPDK